MIDSKILTLSSLEMVKTVVYIKIKISIWVRYICTCVSVENIQYPILDLTKCLKCKYLINASTGLTSLGIYKNYYNALNTVHVPVHIDLTTEKSFSHGRLRHHLFLLFLVGGSETLKSSGLVLEVDGAETYHKQNFGFMLVFLWCTCTLKCTTT